MSKSKSLLADPALAALALPVLAAEQDESIQFRNAGWSSDQHSYFEGGARSRSTATNIQAIKKGSPTTARTADGFETVAGEAGSALVPHKLLWRNGGFVHSDECDHAVRTVAAPTPSEIESAAKLAPGA